MITVVVVAYLLVMIVVGIAVGRRTTGQAESYFLGDRQLGKWTLAISAGAAANTGFVVIGAVGMGYAMGAGSLLYPFSWFLGDLAFWYFFARPINALGRKHGAITASDLIAVASPLYSVRVVSALIVVILLLVYSSAQIAATEKSITSFYDTSPEWAAVVGLAIVLIYTVWGGFRSSVWTDVLQGVLMIALPAFVLAWSVYHVGGAAEFVRALQRVGPNYLDITGGRSPVALAAFVVGFAFAGFGFSLSQPQVTSRIIAGRDDQETRAARWIYILFLQWTWAGMCVVGMAARVIMPGLTDSERALPALAEAYFHPAISGLVLACMLAAIMSSLSALLVAVGSAISIDIARITKATIFYYSSIVVAGVVSLVMALYSQATVFQASLFAATILAASIGAAVVIVILRWPANATSLLGAMTIGVATALVWRAFGLDSIISDALIGFIVAIIVNFAIVRLVKSYKRARLDRK